MFAPIILGCDKTTVSVATGQMEYFPLYISLGNLHNNTRRAHSGSVAVVAFLAIPKSTSLFCIHCSIFSLYSEGDKAYKTDPDFRTFHRQLFHSSMSTILQTLRPGMFKPEVARCPDKHFRRVIWGLGPYIADYPEQAEASCVVRNWCPKCLKPRDELGVPGDEFSCRCQEHTERVASLLEPRVLWDDYGIIVDIVVCILGIIVIVLVILTHSSF